MSFTYTGFVKDTLENILARISTRIYNDIPNISLEPSNPMYQWFKVVALEEMYVQNLIEEAITNMTVMGASGIFLDYHGIEAGVFRKIGSESFGTIECTNSYPSDYYVEIGSTFSTTDGYNFLTYERVGFVSNISMRRGGLSYEVLPTYYTGISIISLYYEPEHIQEIPSGTSGTVWYFTGDIIYWNNTGYLPYGTNYYVATTGQMTISVPIIASEPGTNFNVGADTITINTDTLNIDSCTNVYALSNSSDNENDESLRYRIITAGRKSSTLQTIESMINEVAGVEECKVFQNNSTDRCSTDNWELSLSKTSGVHYLKILSGTTYGFSFYPSTGIGTLQGITLNGKITGNAPDLYFFMNSYASGIYNTGTDSFKSYTYINRGVFADKGENLFQDIFIPLKYNGLDHYSTYRVYMYVSGNSDSNNCWIFTSSGLTISSYRLDHFSGNETLINTGFMYKTLYGIPGYTVSVVPIEGYDFEIDIKPTIENTIDVATGQGFSPVGIQYIVEEAIKLYMGMEITVFINDGYTFSTLSDGIKSNVGTYLRELHPGDDIFYSQVEKIILNTPGVEKTRGLKINLNNGTWYDNTMEADLQVGENEYVILDVGSISGTVNIIEG